MKANKKELLKKLEVVKPGIANKEIIEFTDSFCFTGSRIVTFNDAICINVPFESEYEGTVKADQFFKIVNRMAPDKDGNLNLETEDSNLIISGKRATAGVLYNQNGSLPLEEIELPEKWHKLPEDFLKGLKLSLFCVSNDASTPLLCCVSVNGKTLQSSNGLRVFQFKVDKKMRIPFMIPADRASILVKYKVIEYSVEDNWAHFRTKDNAIISARVYQGEEFPSLAELLDIEGTSFSFPKTTKEVIERAVVFCDGDLNSDNTITIEVKPKLINMSSKSDKGWFKEKIPNKGTIETTFQINAFFLEDILKETRNCILSEEEDFLEFKAEKWNHVIRIKSDKEKETE